MYRSQASSAYLSTVHQDDPTSDVRAELVKPFYLRMMRLNATSPMSPQFITDAARTGRAASSSTVIGLLRSGWRERVMGAWFALLHDDESVVEAVLLALSTSQGSLDAPPLAVAAVTLAGARALPALETYYIADLSHQWGAGGIVSAAIEHLRRVHNVVSSIQPPAEDAGQTFAELMEVGQQLRHHA